MNMISALRKRNSQRWLLRMPVALIANTCVYRVNKEKKEEEIENDVYETEELLTAKNEDNPATGKKDDVDVEEDVKHENIVAEFDSQFLCHSGPPIDAQPLNEQPLDDAPTAEMAANVCNKNTDDVTSDGTKHNGSDEDK